MTTPIDTIDFSKLPIAQIFPQINETLVDRIPLVIEADPGSGKTTAVPFIVANHVARKVLMLEPRRVAARGAADYMSSLLKQKTGAFVGIRMRGESKTSADTRIEIVTDGILAHLIRADPLLSDYDAVIFDEFHERHMQADIGLALIQDIATGLRDDLHVLVMSATMDGAAVASMLGGRHLEASGRMFPVSTHYLPQPQKIRPRDLPSEMAKLISQARSSHDGALLAFLPGRYEIDATADILRNSYTDVLPFHAQLPRIQQSSVFDRSKPNRIILATNIAESAITIPDIKIVVDSGLARRPTFDATSGLSKLVTERVSLAEAVQRAGRAGRISEGAAYRLWARAEEGVMPTYPPAEISRADLTGLALTFAEWGAGDGDGLSLLTPPPKDALRHAKEYLSQIGAMDQTSITPHGRAILKLPIDIRIAASLIFASCFAKIAIDERNFEIKDLVKILVINEFTPSHKDFETSATQTLAQFPNAQQSRQIKQIMNLLPKSQTDSRIPLSVVMAKGSPDRIARRRDKGSKNYLMANGNAAQLNSATEFNGHEWLLINGLRGDRTEAKIDQAITILHQDILTHFPDQITTKTEVKWDRQIGRVTAAKVQRLGAIILSSASIKLDDVDLIDAQSAMLADIGLHKISRTTAAKLLQRRALFARHSNANISDVSDPALIKSASSWLPILAPRATGVDHISKLNLGDILSTTLDYPTRTLIDAAAPESLPLPNGRNVKIDYDNIPRISIRITDAYGMIKHPNIGGEPILIELLSPAGRVQQTTSDIAGFWISSYTDVRKDMRGRYPRHHWPEDPINDISKPRK